MIDHAMVSVGHQIYVFGGETVSGVTNEFFVFNTLSNLWSKFESPVMPSVRTSHVLVSNYSHLILFGGRNNLLLLKDLWIFELRTNIWREAKINYNSQFAASRTSNCQGALFTSQKLALSGCSDIAFPTKNMFILNLKTLLWEPYIVSPSLESVHHNLIGT